MIAAFVWLWLALHLFLVEGWLVQLGLPRIDMAASFCLYFGLFARVGWLPVLVFVAALGRAVLVPGDTAFHFLVLGIPTGLLVPLRKLFARHDLAWQACCGCLLTLCLPKLGAVLARAFTLELAQAPASLGHALLSIALVPATTFALRTLPPLSRFVERSE